MLTETAARPDTRTRQGRRDLKDLVGLAWVLCLFAALLFVISERHRKIDGDFVYFYSTGRIANTHRPEQIYNFDLQQKTFEQVSPSKGDGVYGPSPYPPLIPLFFRPFAYLPFVTALHLWQLCTLLLFCGGLSLLAGAFYPKDRWAQALIFGGALSFCPFAVDTLSAGQLAAIGFFAFSVATSEQRRGRPFCSGLALSLALYKPTLLFLMVPMLLVRKQWRTLAGLLTGIAGLLALVTAFFGPGVWAAYGRMILALGRFQKFLDFPRYVDLFAFWALLTHDHAVARNIILATSFVSAGFILIRAWIRSRNALLVWSATITCTLFLNLYVPIYDAVLAVPAVVASAPVLTAGYKKLFTSAVLLVFACSWIAEFAGGNLKVQVLTVALILLGATQVRACLAGRRGRPAKSSQSHTNFSTRLETSVSPAPEW